MMIEFSARVISKHFVHTFVLALITGAVCAVADIFDIAWIAIAATVMTVLVSLGACFTAVEFLMCIILCVTGLKERSGVLSERRLRKAGFSKGLSLEKCKGKCVQYYRIPTVGVFVEGICCD